MTQRSIADLGAALGLSWASGEWRGDCGGVDVKLHPEGGAVELVLGHPGLPRELWMSPARTPHQGTVLTTGDPAFDRAMLVVTNDRGALGWFDAATRDTLRALLVGRDRFSGLRFRLHRDPSRPGLPEVVRQAVAITLHFARPPAPLEALFGDPLPGVRFAAAERAGPAGTSTLEALLRSPPFAVRAAVALADQGDPGPRPALEDVLLTALGAPGVVAALGRVGGARAVPTLRALRGEPVRQALVAILGRLGGVPGGLSLADDERGRLSTDESASGGLSEPRSGDEP